MTSPTSTLGQAKDAHEKITGERHCSTCQRYVRIELGGEWRHARNTKRWLCGPCKARLEAMGGRR
jgi:hypothetical protein